MGWHLLGGLSKASKEVRPILDTTEVPETLTSFVKRLKTVGIHAVKVRRGRGRSPRGGDLHERRQGGGGPAGAERGALGGSG